MSRRATTATSSTAWSNAAALACEGFVNPLSFRTNWAEAARISSSVAGGSKLKSVLMLRHMMTGSYRDHRTRVGVVVSVHPSSITREQPFGNLQEVATVLVRGRSDSLRRRTCLDRHASQPTRQGKYVSVVPQPWGAPVALALRVRRRPRSACLPEPYPSRIGRVPDHCAPTAARRPAGR